MILLGKDVTKKIPSNFDNDNSLFVIAGGFASHILGYKKSFDDIDIFTPVNKLINLQNKTKFSYAMGYYNHEFITQLKNNKLKNNPFFPFYNRLKESIIFQKVKSCTPLLPSEKITNEDGYWIVDTEIDNNHNKLKFQYITVYSPYIKLLNNLYNTIQTYLELDKIDEETSEILLNIIKFLYGVYITKHFDITTSQMFILKRKNKYYVYDASDLGFISNIHSQHYLFINSNSYFWKKQINFNDFSIHYAFNERKVCDPINLLKACENKKPRIFTKTFENFLKLPKHEILKKFNKLKVKKINEHDIVHRIVLTAYRVAKKYTNCEIPPEKTLKEKLIFDFSYLVLDEIKEFIKRY